MGQSLGDLHFTLGINDQDLDKQLASAKKKIQDAISGGGKSGTGISSQTLKSASDYVDEMVKAQNSLKGMSTYYKDLERQSNTALAAEKRRTQELEKQRSISSNGLFQSHIQGLTSAPSGIPAMNAYYKDLEKQSNVALAAQAKLDKQSLSAANSQKRLAEHSAFTNKTFLSQGVIASQLATILGTTFSVYAIGAFVKKLAEVRGEFELQSVALRAITRDKEAADKIFSQVKTLSIQSPFTFMELLRDTKQLAAFSVETDKLFGTLTRLADVSAGLGVDMNRIILAYGQVRAATVLRGQELRQFTEAGIPIIDMLANKFTKLEGSAVSAGDVFKRISEKMVSFKDVDEIFTQLTSSGGMFFEMQKKQSETLAGKLANLKDAYMIMLNSMGQGSEGVLKGGADALYKLMTNWKEIVDIITEVIAAYGAYKAIVLLANGWETMSIAIRTQSAIVTRAAAMANVTLSGSQVAVTATTRALTGAFSALDKVTKTQWWALAIAGIAALAMAFRNSYQEAHALENELNKLQKEASGTAEATVTRVDLLMKSLKVSGDGTQKRAELIKELNNIMGAYLQNNIKEADTYEEIAKSINKATKALYENARSKLFAAGQQKIEEDQTKKIGDAEAGLRKTFEGFYELTPKVATNIIRSIFAGIRENPELAKGTNGLRDIINKALTDAAADPSNKVDSSKISKMFDFGLSGFNYITDYTKAITDAASSTTTLKEQSAALSDVLGKEEQIIKEGMDVISAKWDLEEKKAKDEKAGVEYSNRMQEIKLSKLADERDLLRKMDQDADANAKQRAIDAEAPEGTLIKRVKLGIDALEQFSKANREVAKSIQEGTSDDKVYEIFAASLKAAREDLKVALATPVSTLISSTATEADKAAYVSKLKEKVDLYTAINEGILGQFDEKLLKKEKAADDEAANLTRLRKEAMDKLNEQYLKDHEDFVNFDLGVEARRIANMEASMAKELKLNDLTFEKREADIVKLRQLRLEELNAAAGIKRGAPNEITDFTQTASVISKLSDKQLPSSERAAVQAASDQALDHEKKMRINNEKDKADAIIAINRDWALKIKEIWRDVNDAFLYGIEKERAALNEKYDDWAKKAKLAGAAPIGTLPVATLELMPVLKDGVLPADAVIVDSAKKSDKLIIDNKKTAAALQIEIERRRAEAMAELNIRYAQDRIRFETEIEYKKNEIRVGGFNKESRLAAANFKTHITELNRLIEAERGSSSADRERNIQAFEAEKALAYQNEELRKQEKLFTLINSGASALTEIFKDSSDEIKNVVAGVSEIANGIAGMVKGYATGDPFAMLSGFVGAIDGLIKATGNLGGDARIKDIEKINKLLEEQARIVAKASREGGEQIKRQAELTAQKAKESELIQHRAEIEAQIAKLQMSTGAKILAWINPFTSAVMLAREISLAKLKKELAATQTEIDAATLEVKDLEQALLDYTAYGATQNTIADAIAQAYLDAKGSVKDFADYSNQILRDAVLNAFKANVLGTALSNTQKLISDALTKKDSETNPKLTQEEITSIRASLNEDVANAKGLWDSLMGAFPELYADASTAKKTLGGEIKAVTEDTAQLLGSLLNAVRGDVSNQLIHIKSIEGILSVTGASTASALAQLIKIEFNTCNTMKALQSVIAPKGGSGSMGITVWA